MVQTGPVVTDEMSLTVLDKWTPSDGTLFTGQVGEYNLIARSLDETVFHNISTIKIR